MHSSDTRSLLDQLGDSDFAYRQFSAPAAKSEPRGPVSTPTGNPDKVEWLLLQELADESGTRSDTSPRENPLTSFSAGPTTPGVPDEASGARLQDRFSNVLSWLDEPHRIDVGAPPPSTVPETSPASCGRSEPATPDLRSHVDRAWIESVPNARPDAFSDAPASRPTLPSAASWLQQKSPWAAGMAGERVRTAELSESGPAAIERLSQPSPTTAVHGIRLFRGYAQPEASAPVRESRLRSLLKRVAG